MENIMETTFHRGFSGLQGYVTRIDSREPHVKLENDMESTF